MWVCEMCWGGGDRRPSAGRGSFLLLVVPLLPSRDRGVRRTGKLHKFGVQDPEVWEFRGAGRFKVVDEAPVWARNTEAGHCCKLGVRASLLYRLWAREI